MKRYDLVTTNYKDVKEHHYFASRKQAYVFVNTTMFMNNKYRQALLVDNETGEIWLNIQWRGQDNYRRKRV